MIPALDVLPHQRLSPHNEIEEKRALGSVAAFDAPHSDYDCSDCAGLARDRSAGVLPATRGNVCAKAKRFRSTNLVKHLESIGYEKREPVEMVGEYSIRGGIFDVFPAEADRPVRVEFFGDTVESIRQFEVESQRSVLKVSSTALLPLVEYSRTRSLLRQLAEAAEKADLDLSNPGEIFPGWEFLVPMVRPRTHNLLSLSRDALIVMDEPTAVSSAAERLWTRLDHPDRPAPIEPEKNYLRWEELETAIKPRTTVSFQELDLITADSLAADHRFHIPTRQSLTFQGNMPIAVSEAKNLIQGGYRVAFFAASVGELGAARGYLAGVFNSVSAWAGIDGGCTAVFGGARLSRRRGFKRLLDQGRCAARGSPA